MMLKPLLLSAAIAMSLQFWRGIYETSPIWIMAQMDDRLVASSEAVTKWLTHVAEIVRQNDRRHLITIGWWGDATTADEIVDFLSFHHWTDATQLAQRIKTLQTASSKPIVLEEVGYPAWDQDGEAQQARSLQEVLSAS